MHIPPHPVTQRPVYQNLFLALFPTLLLTLFLHIFILSMSNIVHIIDVESGNLRSLQNAIEFLGYEARIVKRADDPALATATRVFLPGVGNYGHFVQQVRARGFVAPLEAYIASGRPLMGICVGLQSLFTGSEESPGAGSEGLGYISYELSKFQTLDSSVDGGRKSVPHIGWNSIVLPAVSGSLLYGLNPSSKYYFVHSYAAVCSAEQQNELIAQGWELAVGRYGSEEFVAAVSRANVFATQFHPEKSGHAGLKVIKAFLDQTKHTPLSAQETVSSDIEVTSTGLTRRIIACLDVRTNDNGDLVVTKGDQYDVREKSEGGDVRNLGKPVELAEKYFKQGADEVTFLNITSFRNSPVRDAPMIEVLRLAAKTVFVPLTVGGGIKDVTDPDGTVVPARDVAGMYFAAGADKVSIGTDAVLFAEKYYANGEKGDGTSPMETISKPYGVQAVVISVDPKRFYVSDPKDVPYATIKTQFPGPSGEQYCYYKVTSQGGRKVHDLGAREFVVACEALGAGEILLNCIDKDGSNSGYDLELIDQVKGAVSIPVIASSGAGRPEHFEEVFRKTKTDAALGAGMFHRGEYEVSDVKKYLTEKKMCVRLDKIEF
ncbi:hypothetical protein BABINDRAFT_163075 [Babjeviella inositovora NRRL Y-12698]|uniref:Imidazole glycerol phosphate synthase hisHF n=1 Tax=Babjeviella inositovora NRRL Y-12698 TaxID=984486 RepID=A0A1E3QK93_9ASCO|nr:uncharacterized protein BABINDRAFT_163075 [Babjeviella inositovora NRRL Y-12698]ODQ78038.1 hypothetical protein BABINDRAFT_163075 [Babjeviella inositovora NRRL Y-12698]